ncbi:glycosyltransferase [Desulfurobacterium sp.]|uniref:glycosyltransferase family 2 protein n=1 Tax=Desulfurobacterium sp. TaxID=2004706 RepID=UPI002619FA33|nr:glycosyltransferase [Desulfurobacterium sp.]
MAKISVVIPTYNRPEFLKQAIESVVNQSRKPDELIILDDNPETVKNEKVVLPFVEKFSFINYVKNKKNLGVVNNYKKAFEIASGDYVKLLSDDDILHPDALLLMEKVLDENPDCTVAASSRIMVDESLRFKQLLSLEKSGKLDGKTLIVDSLKRGENIVGEFSALFFRKALVDIDFFRFKELNIRANADWYLWMYLASKGSVYYFDKPLVLFRYTEKNDQSKIDVFISGVKEKLQFLTNEDFHSHLGINFPLSYQVKAFARMSKDFKKISDMVVRNALYAKKFDSEWKGIKNRFFFWLNKIEKKILQKRSSVSVIIVTYNSEKYIYNCLKSLLNTLNAEDEIVVVDNNSEDKTVEIVNSIAKESPISIKLVSFQENLGYSRAVNEGIKLSSRDFLVFLNPDTLVTKGMFENLLSALEKENVGAAGPLSVNVTYTQHFSRYLPVLDYLMSGKEILDYREAIAAFLSNYFEGTLIDTKLLIGLCLAVRRDVVEKIGGLDENLFLGMDDFEFSWRLRENGYKLKIVPSAFVYHFGHASFRTIPEKKASKYQEDAVKNLWEKLIVHYGFGNVPCIDELWNINRAVFPVNFPQRKYNFMFNFSRKEKGENWFKRKGRFLIKNPEVAIVTVSYFSSEDMVPLFASVKKSSYPVKLIVVDNSENDAEFERLVKTAVSVFGKEQVRQCLPGKNAEGQVVVIKNSNTGFAGGVNLGVKSAMDRNIPFIWILNPDTVIAPNAVFELLKASIYTGVPVVTCEIRDMENPSRVQYNGYIVNLGGVKDRAYYVKKVRYLSGSNIFCKSEVFEKVGFLKEHYFLYFEDNDFFERLLQAGIHPIYIPYTFILHKGGTSTGRFLESPVSMYYFVRSMLYFYKELNRAFPFSNILSLYKSYSYDKQLLRSIIEAVYDFSKNITGKKEFSFLNPSVKSKSVHTDEFLKISINFTIDYLRNFLILKPRKSVKFIEFLSLVEKKELLYG